MHQTNPRQMVYVSVFHPVIFEGNSLSVYLSVHLTQCSQSLQLVFIVSAVWSANLENLVLAIAAGLAQQCPVGTWNPRQTSMDSQNQECGRAK